MSVASRRLRDERFRSAFGAVVTTPFGIEETSTGTCTNGGSFRI